MDRIDELKDLINSSEKRHAVLVNELYKTKRKIKEEEIRTSVLKKLLLNTLLENKYGVGYTIYSTIYEYTFRLNKWRSYEKKVFSSAASDSDIDSYFKNESIRRLKHHFIPDKATRKISYEVIDIRQLSKYDIDKLLEELEPY